MPTLFKQSHSPYWYVSYIVDGKRHKISTKTSNRVNAEKTLHSIADKINRNDFFVQEEISNEEFIKKYLLYSQNHKSKGTYERDRTVINAFFKIFDLSFYRINPIHIEEYINNRIKAKKSIQQLIENLLF